jgi:hypothetical protein
LKGLLSVLLLVIVMAAGARAFRANPTTYHSGIEDLFLKPEEVEADYPIIIREGAFVVANAPKTSLYFNSLGSLAGFGQEVVEYYISPQKRAKYANLTDCVWFGESSRGVNMVGDLGQAIGHFQIHINKHDVSYSCAMDYFCSSAFFVQQVEAGRGYLWTTYDNCKKKNI